MNSKSHLPVSEPQSIMPDTEKASAGDDGPERMQNARPKNRFGFFRWLKGFFTLQTSSTLRENLEVVLEKGDGDLTFSPEERAMLSNILSLREVRADDVMVPRADIDAVDVTITLGELIFLFAESRHSRMPVYRETLDDPIGMVHVKDLMAFVMNQAEKNPEGPADERRNDVMGYDLGRIDLDQKLDSAEILRPLLFIPPSMPAFDIFGKMQATRSQMALVIDEYGGTDGLVSMEDVVEAIVGDIEDEHDDDIGPEIIKQGEGRWIADARVPIAEVAIALGIPVDVEAEEEDVDTIGGLLFTELGRVPVRGEVVRVLDDFDFEIIEADPRRIRKVRIIKAKSASKRRRRKSTEPGSETETLPAENAAQ